MKKLLLATTITAMLSGLSAFGQGSFLLNTAARWAWNNNNTNAIADNKLKVGFLFNLSGSGSALISAIAPSVPTNAQAAYGGVSPWNNDTAWNAILNDPNFRFGTNDTTGLTVVATTTTLGGVTTSGTTFIRGTASGGGSIGMILVGWDAQYADPYAAAAAHSALGWSALFNYAYAATAGTPTTINSQDINGVTKFGVFAPIPEPATFALAGLGAAALMIFRRRK